MAIGGGKITHYLVELLSRHTMKTNIKIIEKTGINAKPCTMLYLPPLLNAAACSFMEMEPMKNSLSLRKLTEWMHLYV